MSVNYEPAQINDSQLNQLQQLEKSLGTVLVAVEAASEFAELSTAELEQLQKTEREMGCVLLAYK